MSATLCEFDFTGIEAMFQRLTPQNIQAFEGEAIDKALTALQQDTISILSSRLPNTNNKMIKGVKKNVDKSYATGVVHIMGHPLLHIFETGTVPRYTTGAKGQKTSRQEFLKKIIPAGCYRGQINPLHFFQQARENANVIETYKQSLLMSIENAFNGK